MLVGAVLCYLCFVNNDFPIDVYAYSEIKQFVNHLH